MNILYVDGAALDCSLKDLQEKLGLTEEQFDYSAFFGQFGSSRIFYYDALPAKTQRETDAEFFIRNSEKEAKFSALSRLDGVHVRNGTSRWTKKKGQ